MSGKIKHEPVMVDEVLTHLRVNAHLKNQAQRRIIDATLGFGGHASEFCKKGVEVLGIEKDKKALDYAKILLKGCEGARVVHGDFRDIKRIAEESGFKGVDGILFDLGVNSAQLLSETRGFSFGNPEAPLDMRMDKDTQEVKASDLLNTLSETELTKLFKEVLSFPIAKKMAGMLVARRKVAPFKTVGDFLKVVPHTHGKKTHSATKCFMALRMAVNSELDNLKVALPGAVELLNSGGRLVVISFHSGEDAVVKQSFKEFEEKGRGKIITKKPLLPTSFEVFNNPRSRSARLRCFEKK